ncbi:hypothetical protein BAY61_00690 [Prauserella marina]|uniref:hypothetical protein n=1 Tax=Prauserella marina TaxID=530584 RepID=UPI000B87060D|nr:hypothetical protein [Prauserella marina]ASR33744.1 hypothetical protein BAY61_00690 [Prauserella marina]
MTPQSDLRSFLRSLDSARLADLLCEHAERDHELRDRLLAMAEGPAAGDLAEVSDLLDTAVRTAESVQIASVLDTLQRLLDSGTRADVAPLARRAVDKITAALGDLDDPSGAIADHLDRAVALYARACAAHPPEPAELAGWLLGTAFDRPVWPNISLVDFAEALGEKGLMLIKSTVDEVLAERAGDESRRATARRLNEQHAEVTGDVDTVIAMLSEQLPRIDVSLRIVRILRAAGRHAEAIAHAATALGTENGARRGKPIAALERASRRRAEAAAETADPVEKEQEDEEVPTVAEPAEESTDPVEAVRELLAEGKADEAWKLATREESAVLIPLYREHIDGLIGRKDAQHYVTAAAQLRRLRTLHRKAETSEEFGEYLAGLVEEHRRKTRLIEEIRKARIALPKTGGR